MTEQPLRADEIIVGCVTEDTPKYLGQTLRLVKSIRWFGGELAHARVIVGAVERIDARVRRALEALGADIRIVPRFDARNGPGNRLQWFDGLRDTGERNFLMLDCDTIVVRDPLPVLERNVFHAKIAPFPTVTHEVFLRLFSHFGLALPERSYVTGYTGTPTIPYFNAGVFAISPELASRLVPEWRRYNAILAAEPALVAPCERNLHQAALAIALAKTGIPVAEAGPELNFQLNATHVAAPPGYAEIDPFIIHYHNLADDEGMLFPTPFPRAQKRIDQFNERLMDERSRATGLRERKVVARSSPKQIAVVGMHRSGTSLVALLLTAMGCYAGEEHDFPPPDVFNPTGYWENRDVWALDEAILAALDATWVEPARADLARLDDRTRSEFVERARAIVRKLDQNGTWMMKDPRLALLFPIWREAMKTPICVLVWREPSGVASSLLRRDNLPYNLGIALWEEYTRAMLASTQGLARVFVSYDELLANPIETAAKLHRALVAAGATDLRMPSDDELRATIDPELDHRVDDDRQLLNGAQSALFDALRSGDALRWSEVPPTHPETRNLLLSYTTTQRENAALKRRASQSDNLLSAVFSSRSWRIGFGVTRLWRRFFPSHEETAVDRWQEQPRPAGK